MMILHAFTINDLLNKASDAKFLVMEIEISVSKCLYISILNILKPLLYVWMRDCD